MAYAIARVRKLKSVSAVKSALDHNYRRNTSELINIDQEQTKNNTTRCSRDLVAKMQTTDEVEMLEKFMSEYKHRKNSVLAHEFVFTASSDFFKNEDGSDRLNELLRSNRANKLAKEALEFAKTKGTVLHFSHHMDESNPHVHIITLPLVEKKKRYKNRYGASERTEKTFAARDFISGKESLRELQTGWFEKLKPIADREGVNLVRGVDARRQEREYIEKADIRIKRLLELDNSTSRQIEILEQRHGLNRRDRELKEWENKANKQNRDGQWKRPRDKGFGM